MAKATACGSESHTYTLCEEIFSFCLFWDHWPIDINEGSQERQKNFSPFTLFKMLETSIGPFPVLKKLYFFKTFSLKEKSASFFPGLLQVLWYTFWEGASLIF